MGSHRQATFLPDFSDRLATLDHVLPEPVFDLIAEEVLALVETERSYLPSHKKGGTVGYAALRVKAPILVQHYQSPAMQALVSDIVGIAVKPTPSHDESSCSILFYEKPGDHIGWHYDHNFYRGRHFTVLIPIINRGSAAGLSSARLVAKIAGIDRDVASPPNRMIVFEGAKVLHMVKPIAENERRIVWSMTFCADSNSSPLQDIARRVKDTAFFGLRALWT